MSARAPTPFELAGQIAAHGRRQRAMIFLANATRTGLPAAQAWLDFIYRNMAGRLPSHLQFVLAQKPFRPYLRRHLSARKRMDILRAHYELLAARIAPDNLAKLLGQPGLRLATLRGKSGRTYSLYWGLSTTKEGEIDFCFYDDQLNAPLATLTGVFGGNDFYIGGLRGIKPPLGRNEIVAATRDLYALRPKHAVLAGVCAAAHALGADRLLAPGKNRHISQIFLFSSREIFADYDSFWQEFTDEKSGGDYVLPCQLPRRDASEVKSKKRAEWQRRMALLDTLATEIDDVIREIASEPMPG